MDGDLSNEMSGRGEGEDAIDQLSHRISDYLDTEFNNLSDFSTLDWHTLKFELLLQQREPESFQCERSSTLLPQSQSPEAVQIQASLQNQLPENSITDELKEIPVLDVPEQEDYSFQHTQSFIFIPTNQSPPTRQRQVPLQNQIQDIDFMYRLHKKPQLQTDQAPFAMPQEELSPAAFVHTVSQSTDVQQQYQQHIQEEPFCQQVPLHVSSPPGREPLSPSSTYMHDPQSLMSTVALNPPSQMVRDFMYRIEQNYQLQTEEATFTMPQEMLSLEAFVHSVSESTNGQQQYQENIQEEPRHPQVSLHVSSLPGRKPLPPSSTNMHEPLPHMSTVAQKPSSQTTVGQLSTGRNPEEMKNMQETQQSELNFKRERTDLHSMVHGDRPSARSDSSTVKDTDEKTSKETRPDSAKENNISPFPQHNEPNPGRMKEEEEIQKLAERMKFRREELALTQQDVADQLNILSRKHNICEYFRRRYVCTIENNKMSAKRMLQLKPLLELWLESTRKESHEKS